MVTSEQIIAVAAGEIGTHEGPGKTTKYGKWYGLQGQPWCMEFVQWVYHTAGMDLPYKTASCGDLLNWYRKNDPKCITKDPIPGAIIIFDFPKTPYSTDHTGIFESKTQKMIVSIDGNTSKVSEGNGGWVERRTRTLSYANPTFIIPRGLVLENPEAEEMRYNTIQEIAAAAPWAVPTIEKLVKKGYLKGDDKGFDLSMDMLRMLVIEDRAGVYGA